MSSKAFLSTITARRSIYQLNRQLPDGVTDASIQDLVKEVIKQTPSAFNNQTARALVLFGNEHQKLWDLIWSKLEKQDFKDDEQKNKSHDKVNGFAASYGTVVFFEDKAPVEKCQKDIPLYAEHFPQWSEHTSGIAQAFTWVAFNEAGLGANLQHYGNLISDDVLRMWSLPSTWVIKAQMPFGGKAAGPQDKEFAPIDERVKVAGAKSE